MGTVKLLLPGVALVVLRILPLLGEWQISIWQNPRSSDQILVLTPPDGQRAPVTNRAHVDVLSANEVPIETALSVAGMARPWPLRAREVWLQVGLSLRLFSPRWLFEDSEYRGIFWISRASVISTWGKANSFREILPGAIYEGWSLTPGAPDLITMEQFVKHCTEGLPSAERAQSVNFQTRNFSVRFDPRLFPHASGFRNASIKVSPEAVEATYSSYGQLRKVICSKHLGLVECADSPAAGLPGTALDCASISAAQKRKFYRQWSRPTPALGPILWQHYCAARLQDEGLGRATEAQLRRLMLTQLARLPLVPTAQENFEPQERDWPMHLLFIDELRSGVRSFPSAARDASAQIPFALLPLSQEANLRFVSLLLLRSNPAAEFVFAELVQQMTNGLAESERETIARSLR